MLRRYDRSALDREAQLSYDTLEYFLRLQVEGDVWRHHDFPVNQLFGMQSDLPNFMTQVHQVTDAGEARDYIARLDKFPRKFDQLIESLKLREAKGVIPPQFTVEKVLVQMRGFVAKAPKENPLYTTFKDKLDKIPPDRMDAATRERLLARRWTVRSVAACSRRTRTDRLHGVAAAQGPGQLWRLASARWRAYYAWCVRQHTTTDMTPQQLHKLGLAEVARVGAEMAAILESCGLHEGT